jgi:hypothetical protein
MFRILITTVPIVLGCAFSMGIAAEGLKPEQIYQPKIDCNTAIGTWEILPDTPPLEKKDKDPEKPANRTLMTLRKDGTCRLFDDDHPLGADGKWTCGDHELTILLSKEVRLELFVYGIKGDFMITTVRNGQTPDQLWSRVK